MHTSTQNETLQSAIIVVVVVLLIARRLRGRKVNGVRQAVVITAMALYGVNLIWQALGKSHPDHLTHGDLTLLGAGAVISLGMGAFRGSTVSFFERGGELYSRYTPLTVVLWLVTLVIRLGIDAGSSHFDASHLIAQSSLTLMFALSLAGESIVVNARRGQGRSVPAAGGRLT